MAMAVHNRLELLSQRERGMSAVIESAQGPVEPARRDEPAERHRRARAQPAGLGPGLAVGLRRGSWTSSACWSPMAPCRRRVSGMVARRDLGVASVVMSTRMPFTTPDYLHDKRFAHDASLDEIFRDEGISALVGVPLIWEAEVIGLLFLADRYQHIHTTQSLSTLCTLATHGAVALKNARDFGRVNAALRERRRGARGTRAPRARHPGRCRCARADDLAAGARRAAVQPVPDGGATCWAAACWCWTKRRRSSAAALRPATRAAARSATSRMASTAPS